MVRPKRARTLKAILINFDNGNVHRYLCNSEGEAIGPFARATRRDFFPAASNHRPPPFLINHEPGGFIVPPQNPTPAAAIDSIEPADFGIWGDDPLLIASVDDAVPYETLDGSGEASAFSW
jgi:hypothetical protein